MVLLHISEEMSCERELASLFDSADRVTEIRTGVIEERVSPFCEFYKIK